MGRKEIIEAYENLSRLTGSMRDAAESGDWDALTSLELKCRAITRQLMAQPMQLSESERQHKATLIRKILADDARIRELAEPRLSALLNMLHGADAARKRTQAYKEGSGY